jgi:hypothetical protein
MKPKPFIPSWLDEAAMSPAEMRVFVHLLRSADNSTGIAWPSYERMTAICQLGKSTVRRCLEELEGRKLIAKAGKPFGGSCRYRVLPIVPLQGQLEPSNSSTTGTIGNPPIVPPQDCNSPSDGTPIVPPQGQEGNPKKEIQRRKSKAEVSMDLPFPSDAFREAWDDWQQHRREKKIKLTPLTIQKQFKQLSAMGESNAIAAIDHSIGKGWTGIFPATATTGKPKPQKADDYAL